MSNLSRSVRSSLFVGLTVAVGFLGVGCKKVTETVVEKGVEAVKNTSKGVEDGIDKGRKSGESGDGAFIVSSAQDLTGRGSIVVHALHAAASDPKQSEVDLALENTTEAPLRITKLEVIALDKEGFVKRPSSEPSELTVPPKAKEKLTVTFGAEPATLAKVRIWDKESDLPSATK